MILICLIFHALSRNAYCCVQFMLHRDRIRLRRLGCLGAVIRVKDSYTQMSVFCEVGEDRCRRTCDAPLIAINYYHSLSFIWAYRYTYTDSLYIQCVHCGSIVYPFCTHVQGLQPISTNQATIVLPARLGVLWAYSRVLPPTFPSWTQLALHQSKAYLKANLKCFWHFQDV